MEASVTKRLHISGLTAQITSADLTGRFSSFGKVKALDGLGKLDGNGLPRPYAYVTLEATKGQLAKCVNLLSGTTWKGAKLRLGDAKPDFRERIEKEHDVIKHAAEGLESTRPAKRKRLTRGCKGVHASDMALVTPANFAARSGWRKTPLGRLIRPMRMRPLRPLPPPATTASTSGGKIMPAAKLRAKRKKTELKLVRARRKLIDPEMWRSEYLRGVVLESGSGMILLEKQLTEDIEEVEAENVPQPPEEPPEFGHGRSGMNEDEPPSATSTIQSEPLPVLLMPSSPPQPSAPPTPKSAPAQSGLLSAEDDLAREAANSLALLTSLFGGADNDEDDEWGGVESLSDIDLATEVEKDNDRSVNASGDMEVEIVPREKSKISDKDKLGGWTTRGAGESMDIDRGVNEGEDRPSQSGKSTEVASQQRVQQIKLKDMFAPRAEDVGFSILGNLDVDLELDDTFEVPSAPAQPSQAHPPASFDNSLPAESSSLILPHSQFSFDPSKPFFFPTSESDEPRGGKLNFNAPRDIFSLAREKGWLDGFHRADSADEIRQRWEACKVELTRDWKRRHREAVKSARRRGGRHD